jgi:hypothetical protein
MSPVLSVLSVVIISIVFMNIVTVSNFKLGCFCENGTARRTLAWAHLELITRARFRPEGKSLPRPGLSFQL